MKMNRIRLGLLILLPLSMHRTKAFDDRPLIHTLEISSQKIAITPDTEFKNTYLKENSITVEYNDSSINLESLPFSIVTIPFISCVIPIVWVSEQKYTIPEMDYDYWHALKKIKKIFKIFYPELSWNGELIPERLIKNQLPTNINPNQTALLFSGGLDSTASSFELGDKKQLLITLHGYDVPFKAKDMWQNVIQQTKHFGKTYGHDTTEIIFNFFAVLKHGKLSKVLTPRIRHWLAWTTEGLCHTGVAAPLLYAKGYSQLYMAASFTPEYMLPYGTHPLIDNNIKFGGIQIHHHLMIERCQKLRLIHKIAKKNKLPLPALRVCWGKSKEGFNCQKCSKCVRTMNEIVIEGFMPCDFGFNITLNKLKERTKWFIQKKAPMHYDDIWEWENCQRRIKERFAADEPIKAEIKEYLKWYLELDLEALCNKSTQESDEYRQFYKNLTLAQKGDQ